MPSEVLSYAEGYDLALAQDEGLAQVFRSHVIQSPSSMAVADEHATLTYGALHSMAALLAKELSRQPFLREESVGIVVQHGIADIVTQMAILYAGGTCVPMDPALPDAQIQRRLQKLDTRYILVDRANAGRDLPFLQLVVDDWYTPASKESWITNSEFPVRTNLEHRTHIIHTSGTTSEPKAVQIAARSILQVVFYAPFEPLLPTDVVAHANSSSFDVSLYDIWIPLLRGASIAVLTKAALLDPPTLAAHIERRKITVMAMSAPIMNLTASTYPRAYEKLRVVIIGGEAANVAALKAILTEGGAPDHLINAYGPTECCILCLAHRVTMKDIQAGSVSIGKPIGRTTAYICDESGSVVPDGEEGELLVGGAGVSPGYVNQPEKNAASFVTLKGERLYRTGDVARRRVADGQIEYVGRRDRQVKIRGFRIELEAVEAAMLKTGQLAEAVAVKADAGPEEAAGSMLVAFAVPAPEAKPQDVLNVVDSLKTVLPNYMVPKIELLQRMPLNNHGKIDRKQLDQLCRERWAKQPSVDRQNGEKKQAKTIREALAGLWENILGFPVSPADNNADFFLLGATSLQASLLISQIRRDFDKEVSLLTLYDNSSLEQLTTIIETFQGSVSDTARNDCELWLADSKIADDLVPLSGPVIDWRRDTEGRIFFTGATGFVGAFMLADLLRQREVHQIGCLVRAVDPESGFKRIKNALAKYGVWEDGFADKLLPLCGILEDQYLGLGAERFHEVANWASVIFHLGARVNYTQPYSLHRPANVVGTVSILRLACTGRQKGVHYVSSISCFGPTGLLNGAQMVSEDESLVKHLNALPFDHGYAQSQWVTENMLYRLIQRQFPIAVYRPGFITGHTQTGACNPDDFFSRLIHACSEIQCYPLLPNQRKEFVPVDYVNDIILHIASQPPASSLGHAYHIVPPSRAHSIDFNDSLDLVSSLDPNNVGARGIPYQEWVDALLEKSPERLRPLQPMLAEKVHQGLTRWELHENMPLYDTSNTNRALKSYPGGLKFPHLDGALMQKYLTYLQTH